MKKTLFVVLCCSLFLAACSKTEDAKEAAQSDTAISEESQTAALPAEYGDCKLIGQKFAACEPFTCAAPDGIVHQIVGVQEKRCVYTQKTFSGSVETLSCDLNRQEGEKLAAYLDGYFSNTPAAVTENPIDEFLASGSCFVPPYSEEEVPAPQADQDGFDDQAPAAQAPAEAPSVQP